MVIRDSPDGEDLSELSNHHRNFQLSNPCLTRVIILPILSVEVFIMAFLLSSETTASLNIQMVDTNANKVSRTFSGVLPFSDLTWGIGSPSGATNPTEATNVAELLDDAARAITSLSTNNYSNAKFTTTQSLMDIIQG